MKTIPFYICDVFCMNNNTGNQLAVFIDEEKLSKEEMQLIAAEINFSESTFISPVPNNDGSFNVRIFTPVSEIPFAGHPCLGSAYVIQNKLKNPLVGKVVLRLVAGDIPIVCKKSIWWMDQVQPIFENIYPSDKIAKMLSLGPEDLLSGYPVEEVSTGLPFTIVPLRSLQGLKTAKVQKELYNEFLAEANGKGLLVFCKGSYMKNQHLAVRVFVPWLGIEEDPATGSANGCLAAYLLKNNFFDTNTISLTAGQGYEINRPSELYLDAKVESGKYTIKVGGLVKEVAEGIWKV